MSGFISEAERDIVRKLLKNGVLEKINLEEGKKLTRNGGVAVMCSDGDVDMAHFHGKISGRPHMIRLFGGPLLLAPSFLRSFSRTFASNLFDNIRWGMEAKDTHTVFLYFHAPCGVATMFGHNIPQIIQMAEEAREMTLDALGIHNLEKLYIFFHVKRMNKAQSPEQNTYLFQTR